jgi:hypothetical protein
MEGWRTKEVPSHFSHATKEHTTVLHSCTFRCLTSRYDVYFSCAYRQCHPFFLKLHQLVNTQWTTYLDRLKTISTGQSQHTACIHSTLHDVPGNILCFGRLPLFSLITSTTYNLWYLKRQFPRHINHIYIPTVSCR